MSLVDYASSGDENEEEEEQQSGRAVLPNEDSPNLANQYNQTPPPIPRNHRSVKQQAQTSFDQVEPSKPKLPDASFLLNSPVMLSGSMISDHSSRVAAAMAENESRKRDSNVLASTYPRSKVPKGNLRHSRNIPDTAGGLLRPPQLSGRDNMVNPKSGMRQAVNMSNVVTEDISKLFVRRTSEPSSN